MFIFVINLFFIEIENLFSVDKIKVIYWWSSFLCLKNEILRNLKKIYIENGLVFFFLLQQGCQFGLHLMITVILFSSVWIHHKYNLHRNWNIVEIRYFTNNYLMYTFTHPFVASFIKPIAKQSHHYWLRLDMDIILLKMFSVCFFSLINLN